MSSRFLERWSRLKRGDAAAPPAPPAPAPAVPASAAEAAPADAPAQGLPAVESLDLAADFTAFMKEEVSESLRRAALRKLFSDPHFHFERMDKLDIYIDDYSGKDPIPAEMMQKLRQFETLLRDDEPAPADVADAADAADATAAAPAQPLAGGAEVCGTAGAPESAPGHDADNADKTPS